MGTLFSTIPTKIKVLLTGLVILIIITTIFVALQTPPEQPDQNPIIPKQNTIIGKKITPDTEKKLDIANKVATDGGKTIYSLNSQNPIRTDQIITQNENVIFERIYVPEDPQDPNHLLISTMIQKYGQPEKTFTGSKLWGPHMITYLYGSKGIAFIGNPNTDEVYELQNFTPLSNDEYIKNYGDDIDETPPTGES